MQRFVSSGSLMLFIGMAAMAMGATPHLEGKPTTIDNGTTLTVSGSIADIPAHDVTVKLRVPGVAAVSCTNPGGNEPAGQNKARQVRVTTTGEQTLTTTELASGSASFNITTIAPTFSSAKAGGCPNDNWTAEIKDVTFKNLSIRVIQDGKTVVKQS